MLDAIKPLLDSDLVNEDTRTAIAEQWEAKMVEAKETCLLYTSPSPRDAHESRMPSSA